MTYDEAQNVLFMCNSYSRLPRLLQMFFDHELPYEDCYRLLGEFWTMCDNIGIYKKAVRSWLTFGLPASTRHEMMTDEENAALAALPEVVTIYRGCAWANRNGLSWTLDKNIAAGFPFLNRYRVKEPILITARIRRDRIVALKLDRKEQEVICINPKRIAVEPLAESKAA